MAIDEDLLARLHKLKLSGETWELSVRKAHAWVKRKKGEIFRPYQLLVVSEQGGIVGTRIFDRFPSAPEAWQELTRAMRRPMPGAGFQRRPQKIHTDQSELAEALRPLLAQASIEIDLAVTLPALEETFQELTTSMNRREPDAFGIWKTTGMTEPLARRLYELAAEFYRLAPWKLLREEIAVEVRYPPQAEPRFAVVMGILGEELGVSINDRLEDLGQMWSGSSPQKYMLKFSWLSISFKTPDYLPFDDLDAAEHYGWALPGPDIVPWIVRIGGKKEGFARASLQDLLWLEGALGALSQYFAKDFHLETNGLPPEEQRTYPVETLNGPAQVGLRVPVWPEGFLSKPPVVVLTPQEQKKAERALEKTESQLRRQDWKGAARTSLALLEWLPQDPELQELAWNNLGNAFAMQKHFDQGYLAYSKALEYAPKEAYLWFNRGSAALFTFRSGQAQLDLENAIHLEDDEHERRKYQETLDLARRIVKEDLRKRGRGFTLEQLVEQQELFNLGVRQMAAKRWQEAEQTYRRIIAMADALPQPEGNLGITLLMLGRLDEAEAALRRALEIDPNYKLARENLALLEQTRKTGKLPDGFETIYPFDDKDLGMSLVIRD